MKGKSVSVDGGKEREEITPSPTKPKTKKQPATKKENQVEKSRFVQTSAIEGDVLFLSLGPDTHWLDMSALSCAILLGAVLR